MLNLTGEWHGFFSYPYDYPPVQFIALLRQSDQTFTGSTSEEQARGAVAGTLLRASIAGVVSGRTVRFLKTYERPGDRYDAVSYKGEVTEDGLEIQGVWEIPNSWAGRFIMGRTETGVEMMMKKEETV